jgi:hypothetical protein
MASIGLIGFLDQMRLHERWFVHDPGTTSGAAEGHDVTVPALNSAILPQVVLFGI